MASKTNSRVEKALSILSRGRQSQVFTLRYSHIDSSAEDDIPRHLELGDRGIGVVDGGRRRWRMLYMVQIFLE